MPFPVLQQTYVHSINPYAIQLSPAFGIRWYGLAYLIGFIAAYLLFGYLARRRLTPLSPAAVSDFVFAVALGTIIGGRLGYCVFYDPKLFIKLSASFPFWGVLEIHRGGMSSHGGMIGIAMACILFGSKHKIPIFSLCDLCALAAGIGIFFGRIANFINGELVGRPCSPSLPWAVKFPQDILAWPYQAPDRLTALSSIVERLGIDREQWLSLTLQNPLSGIVETTLYRIIAAVQLGDSTMAQALGQLLTPRHPSQIYEALLEGVFLFCAMLYLWRKSRQPGVITASFFIIYSIVRIFAEQFRMPDAQIGFQWLGLTRGQWLSVALLLVGLILLWKVGTRRLVNS